jgi:hypothetical protein
MKTYIHIPAAGDPSTFTVSDQEPEYRQLQARVKGDIEAVVLDDGYTLYVNETGRLQPAPRLNVTATIMAGQTIVGDVVLTGPVDDEGENESVAQDRIAAFFG